MKTYKMKRAVVGILLVILTLGFCVVGTGAARAEGMGGPNGGQHGFGPGPGGPGGQFGFDGQTPPDGQFGPGAQGDGSSQSGFGGQTPPDGQSGFDGQTPPDGQSAPDGGRQFGGRGDFGGRGGFGGHGGFGPMDRDLSAAIDSLDDGDTKTELQTLLKNVQSAMEALRNADTDSRESAEAAVKEARDALNEALTKAGIEIADVNPPELPEGENGMTPPELPAGENGMTPPEGMQGGRGMTPPERVETGSGNTNTTSTNSNT